VQFLAPSFAVIVVYVVFLFFLRKKNNENIFGEIGVIYLGLFVAYTVLPGLGFFLSAQGDNDALGRLLPSDRELSIHLWRHVLFGVAVSIGYLFYRGHQKLSTTEINIPNSWVIIILLIFLFFLSVIYIEANSRRVTDYYDNFTRFDHLPWFAKKVASLVLRLKFGIYAILLTFLFLNFRSRFFTFVIVAVIGFYEIYFSLGARIIALMILLQAVALYNFSVKKILLRRGIFLLFFFGIFFTILEKAREAQFDFSDTKSTISGDGFKAASEFGSVFFPGFHLYSERASRNLPPIEWPMFFNDIISIFTFGDFDRWNPMGWYTRHYYPDRDVAPFTIGPIAESALWGAEIDLFLRGIVNGLFFSFLVRWFIKRKSKWWALAIYTYCYATCIMTMKYSVFYQLTPIVKNILPIIILVTIFQKVLKYNFKGQSVLNQLP
jgi:hypothetical protein